MICTAVNIVLHQMQKTNGNLASFRGGGVFFLCLATKLYAVDVALCWNGDTQMATIKQQAVNIGKTEIA